MFSGKIKYEVSDPAFYGSLITEQKKRIRNNSRNAKQWLELGRLCKALETEINQRLVSPFIAHLNGNMPEFLKIHQIGKNKDRPLYFTYLAKVVDRTNYPEVTSLTLGQYHFILKRTLEKDYALKEYDH